MNLRLCESKFRWRAALLCAVFALGWANPGVAQDPWPQEPTAPEVGVDPHAPAPSPYEPAAEFEAPPDSAWTDANSALPTTSEADTADPFDAAVAAEASGVEDGGEEPAPIADVALSEDEDLVADEDLRAEILKAAHELEQASAFLAGRPLGPGVANDRSPLDDEEERAARIGRYAIQAPTGSSVIPPKLRRLLHASLGSALEGLAIYEPAERAYANAVALGDRTVATLRGLGRTRVRTGQWHAAEAAFLSAYDVGMGRAADETTDAARENDARALRELGELYLLVQDPREALLALDRAEALDSENVRTRQLLSRAHYTLLPSAPNADGEATSVIALWPDARGTRIRAAVERTLRSSYARLPAEAQRPLAAVATHIEKPTGTRNALLLVGSLMIVFVLARVFRGRGDLVVTIEYPQELRGTFSVHLATQLGQIKRLRPDENRSSSRTEHFLVSRETQFRGIRPQRYYVVIQGVLSDPDTGQILTEPFDERSIDAVSGQTARLDLDVSPSECPVDIKVLWDKRPVPEAGITVRGLPQSLRYARGGELRLRLAMGRHTVVSGSGDRVAELEVEVSSFSARPLEIELADPARLVFKGCPPAVEPYLHGDLSAAARALSRDGQEAQSHLLLGRLHEEQGHPRRASEQYEAAGEFVRAADLRATISQFSHAAELFSRAECHERAAEMYRKSGDWLSAGDAFESAGNLERAIQCYRQAGETARWISALERHGRNFDAAEVALESENEDRATELLQKVGLTEANYSQACLKLADIYERRSQPEMAIERLEAHVSVSGDESPEIQTRIATLLEATGEFEKALSTLQEVQNSHPNYPNLSTKVESLLKRRSDKDKSSGAQSDVATAFLTEQRYEVLEELGRGGMGVVLKARDKRLNRIVALKRLPENLRQHPRAIQLFLREAQAAARLNHRNIVTVYDTDQEEGFYFITMELLEGRPLNAILRDAGRISPRDVARLGMQVAAGLQYAHNHQVIHRDIKTANLFLTNDKTVKIMDFGLAKMMEQVRRESTVIGGTPYYMAPEQALGEAIDHRTDLYSLGITFYELLTGSVPFKDGDVAYQHRHTVPDDPRSRVEGIPDGLAELILDMIEKSMGDRVEHAAEVHSRLEPFARS